MGMALDADCEYVVLETDLLNSDAANFAVDLEKFDFPA